MPVLLGDSLGLRNFVNCERSRTKNARKRTKTPSIRQVFGKCVRSISIQLPPLFQKKEVIVSGEVREMRRTNTPENQCES
jgi:hypothetical protein